MSKLSRSLVQVGEAVQVTHTQSRQQQMEEEVAAYRRKRLKALEAEVQEALREAEQAAENVLELAQKQADACIADVEARKEAIEADAYQAGEKRGFDTGYADGHQQAEAETIEMLKQAQQLLETTYQARNRVLQSFQPAAIQLIAAMAKKILGDDLAENPEHVAVMFNTALDRLHTSGTVRVVVGTELLKTLQGYSPKTNEALTALNRVTLVGDPHLSGYQAYVLDEQSCVDIGLETQVAKIAEDLGKALKLPNQDADEENIPLVAETVVATLDTETSVEAYWEEV